MGQCEKLQPQAGIYLQAQTIPGHRYRIEAWGTQIRSASPVQLFLGLDLSGGQNWQADSVTWHPWDETQENAWVHTQVFVKAQAETLCFCKASIPKRCRVALPYLATCASSTLAPDP